MIGLCANARTSWPSAGDIAALGLRGGWLRSIVYNFPEFDAVLQSVPADVKVCALLRKECAEVGGNYETWDPAVAEFSRRFEGRVDAVECDNEGDLNGDPPSHSVNLVRRAKPVLNAAGMKAILTSVAGPDWQGYLTECRRLLGNDGADWGAFHPYGQRAAGFPNGWGFGELDASIRRAHDLLGLPIAVTEFGIKVGDAGGEQQQATYIEQANAVFSFIPSEVMPFATLFCLGDKMGSPGEQGLQGFGLRRMDSSKRPAWQSFSNANGGPASQPPTNQHATFQLGFLEWSRADASLLGQPLENERGGVPGFSVQKTSTGRLMASNLIGRGWALTFWRDSDGARFLFNNGRSEQIA